MEEDKSVHVVSDADLPPESASGVHSVGEKSPHGEACGSSFIRKSACVEEGELVQDTVHVIKVDDTIADDTVCKVEILSPVNYVEVCQSNAAPAEVAAVKAQRSCLGRRKRGRPPKFQIRTHSKKMRDEEDVCFICFDGGTLVLCDRRGCPKAYHPACIKRDEAFFRSKAKWNCGWHICSKCEKASLYTCYTCTYSLCKMCVKDAEILCVRGNMGFCPTCMKTVMLIENKVEGDNEMVKVDFDDKSSWEYLFKVYWIYMKQKFHLTVDELTSAKNPWKEGDLMPVKGVTSCKYSEKIAPEKGILKRQSIQPSLAEAKVKKDTRVAGANVEVCISADVDWASKELLEFVSHMRNGDTTIISPFDVQALLLEYIKRNNLRDPRCKSQIICDILLRKLFHKKRVGHFEMLKLLDFHFPVKDDACISGVAEGKATDAGDQQTAADGSSDNQVKVCKDRKQKKQRRRDPREPKACLDEEAAIDVHNVSLIYLKRNLVEKLLGDDEKFCQNVIGATVRIKISSCELKDDMYRLVQVIGVHKVTAPYKVGQKTTNLLLEILNLNKKEIISIDTISNQEFTEIECKWLQQTKRSGLFNWMTTGQLRKKAMILQTLKMSDWLETEIVRLGHLRDLANEKGHKKELKDYVEKLECLNTREGRQMLMSRIPEVHAESSLGSDCEFDENPPTPASKKSAALHPCPSRTNKNVAPETQPETITQLMPHHKTGQPEEKTGQIDTEFEKTWHYRDPNGKVQGPFDLVQLRKWSTTGYFPPDLRIWRGTEAEYRSILLTDVLEEAESDGEKRPPSPPSTNRQEGGENWDGKSMDMDLNSVHDRPTASNNCSAYSGVSESPNPDIVVVAPPAVVVPAAAPVAFSVPSSEVGVVTAAAPPDVKEGDDPPAMEDRPETEGGKGSAVEEAEVSQVEDGGGEEEAASPGGEMEQVPSAADGQIQEPPPKSTAEVEEPKESDASVQSSLTNCSPPMNMCSSTEGGWDLLSGMGKPSSIHDFADFPSPTPRSPEVAGKWPAAMDGGLPPAVPVQEPGLGWGGGGGAHVPEIIMRWAGFTEGSMGEWESEQRACGGAARAENPSSWQAIVAGAGNDFNSLGEEESVSDLLAEVDAMESRGMPPSPTSMMKCGGGGFGRALTMEEMLSPAGLDPGGKSDGFSSTEDLRLHLRVSMGGGRGDHHHHHPHHRFSCIEFLDTHKPYSGGMSSASPDMGEAKCSEVSVNQMEIPPPPGGAGWGAEGHGGLNIGWGGCPAEGGWVPAEQQQQQQEEQELNMNWGLWGNLPKPGVQCGGAGMGAAHRQTSSCGGVSRAGSKGRRL